MKYIQKYKAALKINRWPLIDYVEQAEEEQQKPYKQALILKNNINFGSHNASSHGRTSPQWVLLIRIILYYSVFITVINYFCR